VNPNPLISICIPIYNAVEFIEETIDCFINQTYQNWELILQDDCSTDSTWELLNEKYDHNPKIKIYQNNINLGIGKNWNQAYDKATGEYVVIFNADDLVVDDFLARGISYLNKYENIDFVINSFLKSNEVKTAELEATIHAYQSITQDLINIKQRPFYRFSWNYTLAKKTSLDSLKNEFGLFYPTQVCDAMLWYEAYRHDLTAYYTGEIIGTYRMHENNNSKIPLGEFESTLLWLIPKYAELFKLKIKAKWHSGIILLIKYIYACLKHKKAPKIHAVRNIIKYV